MTTEHLTLRMVEAISWLSKGKTVSEAADIMHISKWTATAYIRDAKEIVGAATACGLVGECFRRGIIR